MTERRVYVIDDDEAMRESLSFLLQAHDFSVQAYDSAVSFLRVAPALAPGCIITDLRMPEMTGLQLARVLREGGMALPVIVITGHGDVPLAVEAMKAGVIDFLEKPFSDDLIFATLNTAFHRLDHQSEAEAERAAILARLGELTARERDVMTGLVAGRANKVIADDLGISPRTVEIYRANVMTKMQARSLSELVRMAIASGAF
ncbi:MAG TPA: response regulator FixJ [Caulobacterales bacterium]|nr:response regulator FixJ [Caulobacterales bacterium]